MTHPTSPEVRVLAKVLWDYQRLNEELMPVEVVIAMGCEDDRVAKRAAELYNDGYCKWIICTGRNGVRTKSLLRSKGFTSEAAYFADTANKSGVPYDRILIEDQSTNSGENIAYTQNLFEKYSINTEHIIVVTPPYSERRQQATYAKQWPLQKIIITSPQLTYDTYPTLNLDEDYLINALVGRVQRMKTYADLGYQVKVDIPIVVWQSCEKLIQMGYTKQLT